MSYFNYLNQKSKISAPLDPNFCPAVLVHRTYLETVAKASDKERVSIALERDNGLVSRFERDVIISNPKETGFAQYYIERLIKMHLWAKGGWRIHIAGPDAITNYVANCYKAGGARGFDTELMGRVYDREFEVSVVNSSQLPAENESSSSVGGHLDGCRIGFDLGASDYKIAAVVDGEAVFSTEIPWNPKDESDPHYHYNCIEEGLKLAASHMPRVDAIGGSSAGVYIDNCPRVASLFRSISDEDFKNVVSPLFVNLQKEWGVPLVVINDGDVTALAGAMSLEKNALLGIAMGSSEAAGYMDRKGSITGWLNELAFAPVDYAETAAADEWSGDLGVGVQYFSQQAVNKLAGPAGFSFPEEMPLPERLVKVQDELRSGSEAAQQILETIGVYLGYAAAHYSDVYDYDHALILGRVTSAGGGDIMVAKAKEVLATEFPELNERLELHLPDEKSRRVGQAIAAASLPAIDNKE
jgi:predicted NBD/HSP70 family sugar kinase